MSRKTSVLPCRGRLLLLPEREKTKSGNIVNSGGKNNNNSKTVPKMTSDILRETCETETNRRTGASGSQMPAFRRAHGGGWFSPLGNLGRTMSWELPGGAGVIVLVPLPRFPGVGGLQGAEAGGWKTVERRKTLGWKRGCDQRKLSAPTPRWTWVSGWEIGDTKAVSGLMQGLAATLEETLTSQ